MGGAVRKLPCPIGPSPVWLGGTFRASRPSRSGQQCSGLGDWQRSIGLALPAGRQSRPIDMTGVNVVTRSYSQDWSSCPGFPRGA